MRMRVLVLLCALLLATPAAAETRRISFWPEAVRAAIEKHVDGGYVWDAVDSLGKFHRVQGSPGYRAATEWLIGELTAGGLGDAAMEPLPADGKTRYAHFPGYLGWQVSEGKLEQVSPVRRSLADIAKHPVALADYSQDADVTAELVDVGSGADAAAYQGKDVRGKIVLADGPLPVVHRLAVEERGAAGFVSDFPNQRTAWSGTNPTFVRWGHLSPYQTANRFAFMISQREAAELRGQLAKGPIKLAAHVRARMVPASFDVASATIAGTDAAAGDIVLTAHLCHEKAGANDNASGSATLLGVARTLKAAIDSGALPRPRRTIRFLWLPEISGSQAWLIRHGDLARRTVAGIHLDMVGGRPAVTRAALHLSRSAASVPHIVNEIAGAWVADVARVSTEYAERGTGNAIVSPRGDRDPLVTDLRPLELGSDHQVFEAFGIPMVYFHDWPDVTIHTDHDVVANLDPTKLGRVAYMTAGIAWTLAALPDAEAARLPALERVATDERIAAARRAAVTGEWSADDARLAEREAIAMGLQELASIAAMWPSTAAQVRRTSTTLAAAQPRAAAGGPRDARIPERSPDVRGPLDVYYYDHLAAALGPSRPEVALEKRDGVLAFEALNLVDGKRSVRDIRDLLSGRYAPVPLAEVAEWFELLAKVDVIRFRGR